MRRKLIEGHRNISEAISCLQDKEKDKDKEQKMTCAFADLDSSRLEFFKLKRSCNFVLAIQHNKEDDNWNKQQCCLF